MAMAWKLTLARWLDPHSNNLLYPEVDRSNHVLLYSCRNCNYREEARENVVFRNDLKSVSKVCNVLARIRSRPNTR